MNLHFISQVVRSRVEATSTRQRLPQVCWPRVLMSQSNTSGSRHLTLVDSAPLRTTSEMEYTPGGCNIVKKKCAHSAKPKIPPKGIMQFSHQAKLGHRQCLCAHIRRATSWQNAACCVFTTVGEQLSMQPEQIKSVCLWALYLHLGKSHCQCTWYLYLCDCIMKGRTVSDKQAIELSRLLASAET